MTTQKIDKAKSIVLESSAACESFFNSPQKSRFLTNFFLLPIVEKSDAKWEQPLHCKGQCVPII